MIVKLMSNSDFSLCYHLRFSWKMLIIGKYLPGGCQGLISFLGSKVLGEVNQMKLTFSKMVKCATQGCFTQLCPMHRRTHGLEAISLINSWISLIFCTMSKFCYINWVTSLLQQMSANELAHEDFLFSCNKNNIFNFDMFMYFDQGE